ncbi:NAD-dependent protein deacetylase sirtuin-7-like [Oppia nitens]|uniref:NAD-dependent protein deacetylase sirtuin-7-like n=1 Tax=Oppia nitens TaxID=1686743 RepID=UPI0023DAF85A|nr:NAD-dependent protein deacetylase sirtuin-7-like [Oppia nitens]
MDSSGDRRRDRKDKHLMKIKLQEELTAKKRQIVSILKKCKSEQTKEDIKVLNESKPLVDLLLHKRQKIELNKERSKEVEDEPQVISQKCLILADLIRQSKRAVVYTGAGISTSAQIPDYRGPNGIWTQLKNGSHIEQHIDLVLAEPTFTHMAITALNRKRIVRHVVSQNCDGLHLRSGLPQKHLSEIHGNMYIEVCANCKTQYLRSFDVTENTSLRRHKTGRKCHLCPKDRADLIDTIVHFGEKGKLLLPLNWDAAAKSAAKADLIICLGSSLKILRKYHCLWPKTAKIAIVNLQWTPKDSQSMLKINGKCDNVMQEVMKHLDIQEKPYIKSKDPIYCYSTSLKSEEQQTCNRLKLFESNESTNKICDSVVCSPGWFGKGIKRKK